MATASKRIHPVTDPSGVLDVVEALDNLHHTVVSSLPDATGCNISFTYTKPPKARCGVSRPVFEVSVDFKRREYADFAVRLVESGSILAFRDGFTASHSAQKGSLTHSVVIRQNVK